MQYDEVVVRLKALANPEALAGMARFGISPTNTLGISIPALRQMAREVGRSHDLAEQLWNSGIHEARILAAFIDDPKKVTEGQMERWVEDFDSWDVCDQVCGNLFDKTPFAYQKAVQWSQREEEFVKRAGFALMAALAVHDKGADDGRFIEFLPVIARASTDNRNFVKKAVNWALRQIGKRSPPLNRRAIETTLEIQRLGYPSARWVASDALRELSSDVVQDRLRSKNR